MTAWVCCVQLCRATFPACVCEHLERTLQTTVAKINRACQIKMYNRLDPTFASSVDAVSNGQTRLGEDNHAAKIK